MFLVQRKPGQSILLDNNIKITVIKTGENSVKFGIEAPKEVKIKREEAVPVSCTA